MKKKINFLLLGYSSFAQRRLIKSLSKIKNIKITICSKSKKGKNIFFDNYIKAINSKPDLVYISLTNHLHYKYAKIVLKKNINLIVDKPLALNLKQTKELVRIAKKRKLLLSEAIVFNYHYVFKKIIKILNGLNNLEYIHSNFNVPQIKSLKKINYTKSDSFMDMGPYAASLIRLYFNNKLGKIISFKDSFTDKKNIKSFSVFAKNKKIKYFGNFGIGSEYISQIVYFSKEKIIYLNHQAFALPSNKKIQLIIKSKNKFQTIHIKKDDCIKNYFNIILKSLKNKKYDDHYKKIINNAQTMEKIKFKSL